MALTRVQSIPDEVPTLNRHLRRFLGRELRHLEAAVARSAATHHAERYRKHFDSFAHLCLGLFHVLSGGQSLRTSYAAFSTCPELAAVSGLLRADGELSVCFSQYAASNTSRPAAVFADLLPPLVARVRQQCPKTSAFPTGLRVMDATFLHLSLHLADWQPTTRSPRNQGVRVQCLYAPALDLPEATLVTTSDTRDVDGLDTLLLGDRVRLTALAAEDDPTLAVDLGYYSHRRFAELLDAGIHIVTRLHPQALVCVHEDRRIQPALWTTVSADAQPAPTVDNVETAGVETAGTEGRAQSDPTEPVPAEPDWAEPDWAEPDPAAASAASIPSRPIQVLSDQRITLGSANNRRGAVLPNLRLVTAIVQPAVRAARRGDGPITYRIVTDRFDLAPEEVIQLYCWRWQIELFFRWLKSRLHLPRLLGYSQNAVELSVALAILVHLLGLLAARSLGRARCTPALLAQLPWIYARLDPTDLLPVADWMQRDFLAQLAPPGG